MKKIENEFKFLDTPKYSYEYRTKKRGSFHLPYQQRTGVILIRRLSFVWRIIWQGLTLTLEDIVQVVIENGNAERLINGEENFSSYRDFVTKES